MERQSQLFALVAEIISGEAAKALPATQGIAQLLAGGAMLAYACPSPGQLISHLAANFPAVSPKAFIEPVVKSGVAERFVAFLANDENAALQCAAIRALSVGALPTGYRRGGREDERFRPSSGYAGKRQQAVPRICCRAGDLQRVRLPPRIPR